MFTSAARISLQRPDEPTTYTKIQLTPAERTVGSPQKRTRTVSGFFSRKKRGPHGKPPQPSDDSNSRNSRDDVLQGPVSLQISTTDQGDTPVDLQFDQLSGPVDFNNSVHINSLVDQDDSIDSSDFDLSFAAYVDTMAAHAVSIIQICETLFVAQGWNARYNAGTVRVRVSLIYFSITFIFP